MPEVKFTRHSYYDVAQEHLRMTVKLIDAQQHVAAHYFAGVAVESILRAYGGQEGATFDSSHSLVYWLDKGQLLPNGISGQRAFVALITEANLRWRANQRYMTYNMLDTHLYTTGLDKIRGDRVKYSANRMLEIATAIVAQGVSKWKK